MMARLEIDIKKIQTKWGKLSKRCMTWLKNEIVKDSEPLTPWKDGGLRRSPRPSIGVPDSKIIYDVPYAKRMYYGEKLHFRTPGTGAKWFEKAKSMNLQKWLRGLKAEWNQ
jgi:hypothetical protein